MELVDHHCHGVIRRDVGRDEFEALLTEAPAAPPGISLFDSGVGLAVRRWCGPVLGLPADAPPEDYLVRRTELGWREVAARFLRAAEITALCVDTGFDTSALLSPEEMGGLAGAEPYEIVRLEQVAEEVAASGVTAAGFADATRKGLAARTESAVAVKSIAAYRVGLDLRGERPADDEVARAAGRWLAAGGTRLADETLHRFLVWCGADLRLPIQFHVGYGDPDLDLHRCDPLLLTGLLRALEPTGAPVMLLHNYPYHRQAGYLAQVFPHVYADVGLITHNAGRRAGAILAEALELAPYGKFLFSSDAYGLPEFYHLGALLFRRALDGFFADWPEADAERIKELIGSGNARRVYRLAQ